MKTAIILIGIACFVLAAVNGPAKQKKRLTLEAIFGGKILAPSPGELRWTPDGKRFSYFAQEKEEERALWLFEIDSGRKTRLLTPEQSREMAPSPGQAAIDERERNRRSRYDIASYDWSPDGNRLLLFSSGKIFLYDLKSQKANLLAPSKDTVFDPKFSPDGKWISFVWNHDLWIVPSSGGEERRLTFGGNELLLHGEPDWIYQEELEVRTAYEWAPDAGRIAFLELDESDVPAYPLIDQLSARATAEFQRYPKPGDPNPKVRAGVVNIHTGAVIWADRSSEYIPRIGWADDGAMLMQLLNRRQNELQLAEVNPETGISRILLTERDPYWVDVRGRLCFTSGGREFLWTSDRSGFRHVYLYDRDGQLIRQLTAGEWVVNAIEGIDEENGWIYYSSNQASVLGRDLFRVKKDGSGSERITASSGVHDIRMNPQATASLDFFSSLTQPPEIHVLDLVLGKTTEFHRSSADEFELVPPELWLLKAPDDAAVRMLLYKPPQLQRGRKHPVVVYSYGMPGVPAIQDAWPGNRGLFHQFLAQQGFVVAIVDDRASALRGHKYAAAARQNIGPVAAKDHETALEALKSLPYVNAGEFGIWGWSGGGFTAAYHMTHTKLFKAGVAGAPVTDWRLYDSIYTERYMGLPDEAEDAYDKTSCIAAAGEYSGRLLLIHGTFDDNVHPQHTIQLAYALIRNGKQFDLMIYPNKTHAISGMTENIHMHTLIFEFFRRNLKGS